MFFVIGKGTPVFFRSLYDQAMLAIDAFVILVVAAAVAFTLYGIYRFLSQRGWLGFEKPESPLRREAEEMLFQLAGSGQKVDWER